MSAEFTSFSSISIWCRNSRYFCEGKGKEVPRPAIALPPPLVRMHLASIA